MPVITLQKDRFSKFVGRSLTVDEMVKWLPWLGVDIEEVGENYVKIEFNPNRVDFSSYAGVARAFQGLIGWKVGMPEYKVYKGTIKLEVDASVNQVRPYMLSAVVKDINLDEENVKEIMEMQEDLHWGVGRDRKKAAIGVHNFDVVKPPFKYLAADPDNVRFVPLGKREKMTLREILEKHEKGIAYKHLIEWSPKYPLFIDADGNVLSMPPIINGELTKVTSETRNLLLDVTGPDFKAVKQALNVLVTALADMGGKIETVQVEYPDKTITSPDLTPQKMTLNSSYVNELLGLKLSSRKIVEYLRKCRLNAEENVDGKINVEIPAYRIDILHEVDLVEEVAIGYGYYRLKPSKPKTVTTGSLHEATRLSNVIREILVGLGFTEVMNFTLINSEVQYEKMRKKPEKTVKLANPSSSEYDVARTSLLPSLMKNLMDNKHESFPQKIFEVSDVIKVNEKMECRTERQLHLAGVSSHSTANFSEIKSTVEALLKNLGLKGWKIKPFKDSSFIDGRTAAITIKNMRIGVLGEIHPEVITNFELENPVCGFELNLEPFLEIEKS
ncbi:phenylalanine--tRNA ligase subunit beta [Candidatus Bathyarchaeota archaeon]|nr:phenylalanine--tRNA ligase subunit beta [Candidatus Bathyarchaeota archaeon]